MTEAAHAVAAAQEEPQLSRRNGRLVRFAKQSGIALLGPGAVTLVVIAGLGETAAALLYVFAVGAAAFTAGIGYASVAAGASFLAFNYFATAPDHTLGVTTTEDAVALGAFFLVAFSITVLVSRERRLRAGAVVSRGRAETLAERMRRLEAVARALLDADSPQQVLEVVITEGVVATGARAGVIGLVAADGKTIEIAAHHGYEASQVAGWGSMSIEDPLPLTDAVRTLEPVFVSTTKELRRRYPALAAASGEPSHSRVALPLVVEGRPIGVLGLSFEQEEVFDDNRRMLNAALAAQATQALERARTREAERALQDKLAFLAEASEVFSRSLDFEATLNRIAELAVPRIADWCTVDVVGDDGAIRRVAATHVDPDAARLLYEMRERFPFDPAETRGVPNVIRTGKPEFRSSTSEDTLVELGRGEEELLAILRRLGPRALITVPLGGRVQGALTFVVAEPGRPAYTEFDLGLALDLARRAAVAIDNAYLYRQAERRADAARALNYIADAVVLVREDDEVRYANPAAAKLLGRGGEETAVIAAGWAAVRAAFRRAPPAEPTVTVPVALPAGERWLRISRVQFAGGAVYALHDITEEWELERTRSDFVATASHELRTPLAAVYGSIQTLLREDVVIKEEDRQMFLELAARECRRLAEIIDDLLLAGQLDQGQLRLDESLCDPRALATEVVQAVAVRASQKHELDLRAGDVAPVLCDPTRLRQALINLVDNAVKYSPDGGRVTVRVLEEGHHVRLEVEDEGLGIPQELQHLVFEKFYRLDPALSRGVGGAGLGLYITRQLVERMHGTLAVESAPGRGSTFAITIPAKRTSRVVER